MVTNFVDLFVACFAYTIAVLCVQPGLFEGHKCGEIISLLYRFSNLTSVSLFADRL